MWFELMLAVVQPETQYCAEGRYAHGIMYTPSKKTKYYASGYYGRWNEQNSKYV